VLKAKSACSQCLDVSRTASSAALCESWRKRLGSSASRVCYAYKCVPLLFLWRMLRLFVVAAGAVRMAAV